MKKKASKNKPAPIKHKIRTDYLEEVYSKKYLKVLPQAVKEVRRLRRELGFDAIAFTGSSGAALAFPLSFQLQIPLIHVRKGSSHYYGGAIEGTVSSKKYLIVDDFIESGSTIKRIIRKIKSVLKEQAQPVGIYLYVNSNREDVFSYKDKKIPVYTRGF